MLVRKTDAAADRVRRARLPVRLGLEGLSATGSVCGIALPPGLRESDRLPEPIFTPATKAESGHDMNISEARGRRDSSAPTLRRAAARRSTLALYRRGVAHAESRGIILADTKFEFGLSTDDGDRRRPDRRGADARLVALLAARPVRARAAPQPSFDKQFVRDYLEEIRWNKQPPVPSLPDDVVAPDAREVRRGVPAA